MCHGCCLISRVGLHYYGGECPLFVGQEFHIYPIIRSMTRFFFTIFKQCGLLHHSLSSPLIYNCSENWKNNIGLTKSRLMKIFLFQGRDTSYLGKAWPLRCDTTYNGIARVFTNWQA